MLDDRIARIALRQRGVISRRQLYAAGLSPAGVDVRVRRCRLFPVARGVFALGPHFDAWGRRYAAVLAAGGDPQGTAAALSRATTLDSEVDPHPSGHATKIRTYDRVPASVPLRAGGGSTGQPALHHEILTLPADQRLVVLSHWSALHAYGLIDRAPVPEHVTVEGTGARRPSSVRIHRARTVRPREIAVVEGLPMTTPARTILDSALGASVRQAQRLIREAEYRELLGAGAIADVVRRNPFHPASSVLREADPRTAESGLRQTPIEDRMGTVLERIPLAEPLPQHPVIGASGQTYRADFAWPDLRLIVETDGRTAHDRSTSFQSDRQRDADLAAAGWLTLRFTSLQLGDPDRVAATIVATAGTRTAAG